MFVKFGYNEHPGDHEFKTLRISRSKTSIHSHIVTTNLIVWSRVLMQHRPSLSGLQSKLVMGCVEMTREFKSSTDPAIPIGAPSCSCFPTLFMTSRATYNRIQPDKVRLVGLGFNMINPFVEK